MEELPTVGAYTLAQEPQCGERARRLLDGARPMNMAKTRRRLSQRLRGDAALAHSERRKPNIRDFPTPNDLSTEEQAVYRAAAAGYLALFGDTSAIVLDLPRRLTLDESGIELAANPGLCVETDEGSELRVLAINGTEPRIAPSALHAAAMLAPSDALPIRVVAADLLSLETTESRITGGEVEAAWNWATERAAAWRAATDRPTFNHDGCRTCEFVWGCPTHPRVAR
ncbi:MAG TPA: hypothetical protein VGI86_06690 [Acidimicrobiia bacterium]